jgi:hypothetical protein
LWEQALTLTPGLVLALSGRLRGITDRHGSGRRPGRPFGPRRLVLAAGSLAGETAPWLLVAWHPLLALVTFAVPAAVAMSELRSARLAEGRMERKEWLRAACGYALMGLALMLWLVR